MKSCELCDRSARMYCESDQANLCWDCDAKVHGANFLVARHPRVLLCRRCQSPTPWRAAGARLGPTFSTCDRCSAGGKDLAAEEGGGEEMMEDGEEDYDDEVSSDSEEFEEEEGENQVVPWTQTPPPPPPPESSSSGEESFFNPTGENADFTSQHDLTCSDSNRNYLATAAAAAAGSTDKDRRRSLIRQVNPTSAVAGSRSTTRIFHSIFDLASSASRSPSI